MRAALLIGWRDYRSAFDGPLAYVLVAGFLLITGGLACTLLFSFSDLSEAARAHAAQDRGILTRVSVDVAVVAPLLQGMVVVLVLLAPLLTMRLLAEEQRAGTMELLLTAPVSPWSIVLGKFLGGLLLVLTPLALSAWHPLVLAVVATPDLPPLVAGYLALGLVAAAFTAVGLFASSLTASPLVAALLGLALLLLSILAGIAGAGMDNNLGLALEWLSVTRHFAALASGAIETGDLAFFAGFTFAMLFLTERVLESRRWR